MKQDADGTRWLIAVGTALTVLLAVIFAMPRSWLSFLLPSTSSEILTHQQSSTRWLIIQPPPNYVEAKIEPSESQNRDFPEPEQAEAAWWRDGWAGQTAAEQRLDFDSRPAPSDTLLLLMAELGLGAEFSDEARPDSVLAARLHLMRTEDGFEMDAQIKLYLDQVRREAVNSKIRSRAADLFKEHLGRDIEVTDHP